MLIAVAGATGRLGRHVVEVLEERGHGVVPISRNHGLDVITAVGLERALTGVDCIIDAATGPSPDEAEATAFFTTASRNLHEAGLAAGVRRMLVVSIIGIEGLKVEPLAADLIGADAWPPRAVERWSDLAVPLEERRAAGFGGTRSTGAPTATSATWATCAPSSLPPAVSPRHWPTWQPRRPGRSRTARPSRSRGRGPSSSPTRPPCSRRSAATRRRWRSGPTRRTRTPTPRRTRTACCCPVLARSWPARRSRTG